MLTELLCAGCFWTLSAFVFSRTNFMMTSCRRSSRRASLARRSLSGFDARTVLHRPNFDWISWINPSCRNSSVFMDSLHAILQKSVKLLALHSCRSIIWSISFIAEETQKWPLGEWKSVNKMNGLWRDISFLLSNLNSYLLCMNFHFVVLPKCLSSEISIKYLLEILSNQLLLSFVEQLFSGKCS